MWNSAYHNSHNASVTTSLPFPVSAKCTTTDLNIHHVAQNKYLCSFSSPNLTHCALRMTSPGSKCNHSNESCLCKKRHYFGPQLPRFLEWMLSVAVTIFTTCYSCIMETVTRLATLQSLSNSRTFPRVSQTFPVNIYGVSTLATVAIQNEMHVISHCNTHINCHDYDNCVLQ